ncbi:MAG: trigger factor [Chromatiaceae bacterium]|nr:trigger factor [Chromatiaceae bacterium]
MQVSVETGEGLERRMRIDLPFERIQGEVDKRLQQLARSARLPGFRPGKVPINLLRQRYGEQVQQEVFGELVQTSFSEAVAKEALRPAGMPRIEPDIDHAEKRYGYTAVFEVLPQFELAPLSGKVLKRPVAQVTDADLEAMLERLRTQRKSWQPAQRPAQSGDRLTVAYTGTIDGEAFEGGSSASSQLELGSGRMIPGFEDGLIGARAGETRSLDITFPEGYHAAPLAGKPVRFEVTVNAVDEPVLPEVDADFARSFGVEDGDVERFRSDVRANMERELKQRIKARTKEAVMDVLVAENAVDIPAVLVSEEVRSLKEQMRQNLGGGRMELPDNLFEDSARRRVALGLIIAEIVKKNGIVANAASVREAVEEMASTYEQPQEVVDYYYADRKRLAPVESLVLEERVVDWVLGQVAVEDEATTFQQLTEPGMGA